MRPAGAPRDAAAGAAARAQLEARGGIAPGVIRVVLSPYRVCPIGAHSDHQHGPVLGAAIDLFTALAFAPSRDPLVEITSAHYGETWCFDLGAGTADPPGAPAPAWTRYARGALAVLRDRLPARPVGLRACVTGALPGGGLSSSASVVIAYLMALAHVNGVAVSDEERVALARRVENEQVGVACGILDPASIVGSRRGHLLAIDTAAGRWEPVALGADAEVCFLVAHTGLSRNLSDTDFNRRVDECREAARRLSRLAGRAEASLLGELPDEVFDAHLMGLPDPLWRRARHFATERARVRDGLARWRRGDLAGFGALMSASCESSICDYQTGSPELVRLQAILLATPGVLGARFSGAGFGGCGVALVEPVAADEAAEEVARRFAEAFPLLAGRSRTTVARGEDGARIA